MSLINQVLRDLDSREPLPESASSRPSAVASPEISTLDWRRIIALLVIGALLIGFVIYIMFTEKTSQQDINVMPVETQVVNQPEAINNQADAMAAIEEPVEIAEPAGNADDQAMTHSAEQLIAVETDKQSKTLPAEKPEKKTEKPVNYLPLVDTLQEQELVVKPVKPKAKVIVTKVEKTPLQIAKELISQGRLTEAETNLRKLIGKNPADLNASEILIGLLLRNNRNEEASEYLDAALNRYPGRESLVLMQSKVLLSQQQKSAAIQLLEKQIAAKKAGTKTLAMLAPLYQQQANYQASAKLYKRLVRLEPEQASHWVGLAISLEALNELSEASKAYKQALSDNRLSVSLQQYALQRIKVLAQQGLNNC